MKNCAFAFMILLLLAAASAAQGSAFSFQGRLNDGTTPANGSYDLQFSLYAEIDGGSPIASTIPKPNTTLVNGVFSVTLDFGSTAFNNPSSVFIEIGVKPAGSPSAHTILGPRQQLTVVPFAVRANSSGLADSATNAANANKLNGLNSGDFIRNSIAPIANQNFNIVGNGVINGTLNVAGNAAQNRDKGGFVKAMAYISHAGVIMRCFNGITGSSTGTCGMSCIHSATGFYEVRFTFQVSDRFVSVTPRSAGSVNIITSFDFNRAPNSPNSIWISTNIADVDWANSYADQDFMLVVY